MPLPRHFVLDPLRNGCCSTPCHHRQPQWPEQPLGYRNSDPGPGRSLFFDFRGASRVSPRPPRCLLPPQPRSPCRGRAGDSPRETPTQYKPQRVNNYGCDCGMASAFPGALTAKRSSAEAEGRKEHRDTRRGRSRGRSRTPQLEQLWRMPSSGTSSCWATRKGFSPASTM